MRNQSEQTRGNPSVGRQRKSSRDLVDENKKQFLTEARSEILKHANRANLTKDYSLGLKGQFETEETDLKRTVEGMHNPDENKIFVTKKQPSKNELFERTGVEDVMRRKHCRKRMKCVLINFQETKLIENHNIINELMVKVQELQYEINCMNDPRDFKHAEWVRNKPLLSHVPTESALFLPQAHQGGTAEPRQKSAA